MDFNTIIGAIGSVGFPIAWFFNKVNENYRQDIKELTASHKEEAQSMRDALNNNTLALQKLLDKLERD